MHSFARYPERESTELIRLRVSPYDRVTSVLVALLILAGLSVGVLTLLLILDQTLVRSTHRISVEISTAASASGAPQVVERNLEQPRHEELAVPAEPQFDFVLASVIETSTIEAIAYESDLQRNYKYDRTGKSKEGASFLPEDEAIIPRWKRWQVRYSSNHVSVYAQQLDYFGIELGAIGGEPKIDYARDFQNSRPVRRQGTGSVENRLYLSWSSGSLRRFDQELLERAGVRTRDRVLLQFYSEATEDRMAWIEMEHAKKHGHSRVQEIFRTYFGIRSVDEGYEFYVMDQLFRAGTSD